jgi:hypothetical protein
VPGDVVVCTNDAVVLHMSPQVAAGMFYLVDSKVISRNNPIPISFVLTSLLLQCASFVCGQHGTATALGMLCHRFTLPLLCPCSIFGVQEKALVVR